MNVLQQGGLLFPTVSGWTDVIQTSSSHVEYDLAAARAAMGLQATESLFVIFACDGPFWFNAHGNAAIPSGNTVNGTGSEFSPNQRYIDGSITSLSFVSANAQNLSMQFYRP
jgi:hypothetical protein